jgi:hypothetical protein
VQFINFDSLGTGTEKLIAGVRQTNEAQLLPVTMQNFPSEVREELKAPYLHILNSPELRSQLADAYRVFDQLNAEVVSIADIDIEEAAAAAAAA